MRAFFLNIVLPVVFMALMVGGLVSYNKDAAAMPLEHGMSPVQQIDFAERLTSDIDKMNGEISQQQQQRGNLLTQPHAGFITAVNEATEAVTRAENTSDVVGSLLVIIEAQKQVLREEDDYHSVVTATETVKKETGKIMSSRSSWAGESVPAELIVHAAEVNGDTENLQTLPASHPARLALNAVGGADIKLGSAKTVCGKAPIDNAAACAYASFKVVLIAERDLENSYDYFYDIMMHEYAHQVQFSNWESLESSQEYKVLFEGDLEWLADCMSAAKIQDYRSGYEYSCTSAQVAYGAKAWSGDF